MIVGCSQCGAKINRKDESRFFICPYCASSLVLEGGRSFGCFIMEHGRNDLWARALFRERLRRAGVAADRETVSVELSYIPFWVIRRTDGSIATHPAAETHNQDLSSVKVPPGRLVFYEEGSHPNAPVVPLSVPFDRALGNQEQAADGLARVDLVYLPVYSMQMDGDHGHWALCLVGDSSRLYSGTAVPGRQGGVSIRSLVFFGAVAGLFAAVALLIQDVYLKAAALGVGGLVFIIVSPLALGRK
jgi:hypothetical protein